MPKLRPFRALRPTSEAAPRVVALPYDVMNRQEAAAQGKDPDSYLHITRAEIDLPLSVDQHADQVHEQAAANLADFIDRGILIREDHPCLYLYRETWQGAAQVGIVGCAQVADYQNGIIERHEKTLAIKEADRIKHFDRVNAHTEPVFLTYRANKKIDEITARVIKEKPLLTGETLDGTCHELWPLSAADTALAARALEALDYFYIADGHHRSASAAKVGLSRTQRLDAPWNEFLVVAVPDHDLRCLPYNRLVLDWGDTNPKQFLADLAQVAVITELGEFAPPEKPGAFSMYLGGKWYACSFHPAVIAGKELPDSLDVSLLQEKVLSPLLGITDPRTSERIEFVGGIRGDGELKESVDNGAACAFYMYPTQIAQVMKVADAGEVMPPKSTWFEPKLGSGLFAHPLWD
ncbi:DUF1015 domain-containing protein [Varibaculum massiliense]|uniref:DUF1015 domain-containing protein n=1 Tax=Varibaculum massiliense TaxID=1852372 RepID=UPI0008DAA139|nr:DUF1015 family protein [Varibaculum massiliense]